MRGVIAEISMLATDKNTRTHSVSRAHSVDRRILACHCRILPDVVCEIFASPAVRRLRMSPRSLRAIFEISRSLSDSVCDQMAPVRVLRSTPMTASYAVVVVVVVAIIREDLCQPAVFRWLHRFVHRLALALAIECRQVRLAGELISLLTGWPSCRISTPSHTTFTSLIGGSR